MHEYIIWCDTDLSRVNRLSKGYLRAREVDLGVVVDNKWAFSSKLKDAGCQVLGRCLCNYLSNLC